MVKISRLLFVITIFMFNCAEKKEQNQIKKNKVTKLFDRQASKILNQKLESLQPILGDSIDYRNKVIMIYNGFDCNTCVDFGFNMIKRIDSLSNYKKGYIVSSQSSDHYYQSKNEYFHYVFNDKNDLIKKELKYIHTPVLFYIDDQNRISKVLFPNYDRSEGVLKEESEFLDYVVN